MASNRRADAQEQAAGSAAPDDPAAATRLWTPWRMRYVGGDVKEDDCLFCARAAANDDVRSLIVYRGEQVFVILNLYPYNTGHLMIVPNAHVADPADTPPDALADMATLLGPVTVALRRALDCHGFNIGINVGAVAGAGVADHLHQHVVPRWTGDANYMPILAATMVLPELIPVTYAKLRAEIGRADLSAAEVKFVLLTDWDARVLVKTATSGSCLPSVTAAPDEAVWRAAARSAAEHVGSVEIAGWAGPLRSDRRSVIALTLRAMSEPVALRSEVSPWNLMPVAEARMSFGTSDRETLERALVQLAPSVATLS